MLLRMRPGVAGLIERALQGRGHAGALDGAAGTGEAHDDELRMVVVGLWLDGSRVVKARWKATSCAALMALAELACQLTEEGAEPAALGGPALAARITGLHPAHHARADLVARAVRAASTASRTHSTAKE